MHGIVKLRKDQTYTREDLDLLEQYAAQLAREDFWQYRLYMRPKMLRGWFLREVAIELQRFYEDWKAGKAPILVLVTPPQHGKSWSMVDFISWCQGHDPDSRAIFTSYSDRLGRRANLWLQRWYATPRYQRVFPGLSINPISESTEDNIRQRTLNLLEYVGREGSFRNTTVNGPINGESLDLGFIDDPLKGRSEANSKLNRDKAWDWFTDDFFSRFSERAGLLINTTRWHVDDPVGRLQEHFDREVRYLKFPALATKEDAAQRRVEGRPNYREVDEPLFPELKSKKFLLKRKTLLTMAGWLSQYQGDPIVVGGGMFLIEQFKSMKERPVPRDIRKSVRYWDKAGTEGGGAFTAGVRMDELKDGRMLVSDVRRGQWGTFQRETSIKQTAEIDNSGGYRCETWVEQEPGSGGKESAERTIINLRGVSAFADRVTGKKEVRAEPYAAQQQAGNVFLLSAPWNQPFIDEHETAPNGTYKDQWDAAGGAFMKVTGGPRFNWDAVR